MGYHKVLKGMANGNDSIRPGTLSVIGPILPKTDPL